MIYLIKASVKLKRIYVCHRCGRSEPGDQESFDVKALSVEALKDKIEQAEAKSVYMPVGWSYNGNGKFWCGCGNDTAKNQN